MACSPTGQSCDRFSPGPYRWFDSLCPGPCPTSDRTFAEPCPSFVPPCLAPCPLPISPCRPPSRLLGPAADQVDLSSVDRDDSTRAASLHSNVHPVAFQTSHQAGSVAASGPTPSRQLRWIGALSPWRFPAEWSFGCSRILVHLHLSGKNPWPRRRL